MKVKPTKIPLPAANGDGLFNVDQLNSYLQAVREADLAEFEAHMKGEVDAKKGEAESLKTQLQETRTKLEEAERNLVAAKAASNGTDISAVVDEATKRVRDELTQKFEAEKAEHTERLKALEEKDRTLTLKELRNRLIAEAGGESEILPSLITGTTEEEIRQQIEFSKGEVLRIRGQSGAAPGSVASSQSQSSNTNPPTTALPTPVASGGQQPPRSATRPSVREYAREREKTLAETKAKYG